MSFAEHTLSGARFGRMTHICIVRCFDHYFHWKLRSQLKVHNKMTECSVLVCFVPGLNTPRITLLGWEACVLQHLCATWAPQFRLRRSSVCRSHMHAGYLPVSGPLDFRLVIQVLLSPRMILNACVRRLHPCLTSLAEDGRSKWRPGQDSNS